MVGSVRPSRPPFLRRVCLQHQPLCFRCGIDGPARNDSPTGRTAGGVEQHQRQQHRTAVGAGGPSGTAPPVRGGGNTGTLARPPGRRYCRGKNHHRAGLGSGFRRRDDLPGALSGQ
mmetsp:Transcript_39311/g.45896  ORF Transcript_39311/g.45896 Transcript_39311/m.45896 type:complete len:116 (-) Transcript_39311:1058-1405(-)